MNEVRNIIVGFEMGERTSQICYYDRTEGEPVSLSVKAGQSQYTFPTCISKKPGEEVYHYGVEAEYFASQRDEILIDRLFECCLSREKVQVEDQLIEPARLAAVFLSQALGMLGANNLLKNISGIMVTVPRLNKPLVDNLKEAFRILNFPAGRCFLQNYDESFYYYTIAQKPEFWSRKVGLFTFEGDEAAFRCLAVDRKTRPATASVKAGKRMTLNSAWDERDADFCRLIQESFGNDIYSGAFLVGSGFDREWAVRSIPLLCKNQRHVFYGNNLYCKGACYGAKEKVEGRLVKDLVYQGEDVVTAMLGMEMLVSGVHSYYSLAEPGIHWYEAKKEFEILLENTRELVFMAGEPKSPQLKRYSMDLPGLPERPPKATRLKICVEFESLKSVHIHVEDLGLGDLFPSSGLVWDETLIQ
ncbi:MAG: DUF5716 family protein [Ruminococcus sp.]|jgi:hypothetical protein